MTQILMRAGKSPFDVVSAEDVYWDDLIAKNSGNLLFAHSAYKMLSAPGTRIDVTRYKNPPPSDADEINEKYDQFVIPLANAFRPEFEPQLKRLTALIKNLKIPCIVVGIGAQADIEANPTAKRKLDETAKAFVSAVLDKSHSVGVRGEFTQAYLNGLGFKAVTVIGCPSMFLYGDKISVTKKATSVDESSTLAFNLTGGMPDSIVPFYDRVYADFGKATYIPQGRGDLSMLLWGLGLKPGAELDPLPRNSNHPVIRSGRARYFTDVPTWINFLKTQDFSFGTRIHGNVFAILAGTPGFVIAHDSRTLELSRYFEIPHRKVDEIKATTTVSELYAEADYTGLMANHPSRFGTYRKFLEDNGINHIFGHEGQGDVFEKRLAEVNLPDAVGPIAAQDRDQTLKRLAELAEDSTKRIASLETQLTTERQKAKKQAVAVNEPKATASEPVVSSPTASHEKSADAARKSSWWSWKSGVR